MKNSNGRERRTARTSILILVSGFFIAAAVFAAPIYTVSSSSLSRGVSAPPVSATDSGNPVAGTKGYEKVVNSTIFAGSPVPAPSPITTYEHTCTTPQSVFAVGETVCVKVTGIQVGGFFQRSLSWGAPDSTVVRSTVLTTDPQTDTLLINATSSVNGRTIDNRGNWTLVVLNPFFFFPEALATFTVVDAANPTADVGAFVTASNTFVSAGSQVVFQVQVNNYGPDASNNVQLLDDVPANTTFVSFNQLSGPVFTCSSPVQETTGTTTCSISSLSPNSPATFVATYKVNTGTSINTEISNTASVTSLATQTSPSTPDSNNRNDSSTASSTVASAPCVLSCPSDINVNADAGQAGATVTYSTPGFTGDCGTETTDSETGQVIPVISCSPASGSFFSAGTTPVICTSQTGTECTFQVIVQNPGGLSITLNGANPASVECGSDFNDPGATAVNSSGQTVPVVVTSSPQGFNPDAPVVGTYTLTYTATEGDNSVSTTRTVNVADTVPPAISISGANPYKIVQGSCQPFVDPGVSANDGCAGPEPVTSSISGPNGLTSVDNNTPGTYTITYTATDGAHQATAQRTVIVGQFSQDESDQPATNNQPPTITLNGDEQINIECGTPFTDPGATASVCGGSVAVTTSGTVDIHTPGTYTITYSATANNLTSTATRSVTVTPDNSAPTITLNGTSPMTVECHTSFTDPGAMAHDACAGDFAATASGSVDPNTVGTYTITYNATDPSGFTATTVTRTVNVVDTTAPTVTAPANVTVNTGAGAISCGATVSDAALGTASANDSCAGSLSVTRTGVPAGNFFPVGTTTITYSANDGHNTGTATQTVTVIDNTPPTITAPASVTAFTGAGATSCGTVVSDSTIGVATASDNCAGVTVSRSGVPAGNVFPVGNTTITWTATDAGGLTATATQIVTVIDNTPPTITTNGQTPSMWPPDHSLHTFQVSDFVTSVFDNCGGVSVGGVVISRVTSDELDDATGGGDGNTTNDIQIAADCKSVKLRSERAGSGDGRVYTITFRLTDTNGNVTTTTARVTVAHDQGAGPETVIDSGPHFTVSGNCP